MWCSLTVVKMYSKLVFKLVACCIYAVMVVDNTNMQMSNLTQGLGIYSVKCWIMNTQA